MPGKEYKQLSGENIHKAYPPQQEGYAALPGEDVHIRPLGQTNSDKAKLNAELDIAADTLSHHRSPPKQNLLGRLRNLFTPAYRDLTNHGKDNPVSESKKSLLNNEQESAATDTLSFRK